MFAIARMPASFVRKGSRPLSSEDFGSGFPELPPLSTNDDFSKSEFPQLPISAKDETSPEPEFPALVAEPSCPKPEFTTIPTMRENCSMCPFSTFCQDKLQCSAFLTGFGEQIVQRSDPEEMLGGWSGQKLFEVLWSKS